MSKGTLVKKNDSQAVEWYHKAAEQGYANAQNNLGFMYANGRGVGKDDVQAVVWYRKAADNGLTLAQYNLGTVYATGRGVNKRGDTGRHRVRSCLLP